jgi:hypothetical protein
MPVTKKAKKQCPQKQAHHAAHAILLAQAEAKQAVPAWMHLLVLTPMTKPEPLMKVMMSSRGMGDINPSKMPGGKKKARRDDTDFTQYKEGGKVNAAGNYTKPSLRKRIVSQVKAAATHGTGAGQWSARKAQLVAKKYKAAGGGYKD